MKGKSVNKIMSSFTKTVKQLRSREEQAGKEVVRLESEREKIEREQSEAAAEQALANKMATKLEELFTVE